jgi:1,4-dihydroxy-2-naphthoyl-CoA synthase
MAKVLYEKDGRIGRITLNRPEVMNAIDDDLPGELSSAVTGVEGLNFKSQAETVGWKRAVRERDEGTYDWTLDRPVDSTE